MLNNNLVVYVAEQYTDFLPSRPNYYTCLIINVKDYCPVEVILGPTRGDCQFGQFNNKLSETRSG